MEKPTIFFSHSSHDRELILPVKAKLDMITAQVLDIFMSSDGQSIPFGNNWVHRIEEGLDRAQIMFVFVTPASIDSSWVYFEAGHAYAKGIEVIPVGLGIKIGQLKAPLNLLQGFDINSGDSLNNFISIINRKFQLQFPEAFTDEDYQRILAEGSEPPQPPLKLNEIFDYAEYELSSQRMDGSAAALRYDIDDYFTRICEYLDREQIPYSCRDRVILVSGIRIKLVGKEREPQNSALYQEHKLVFKLSMQGFGSSFPILKQLLALLGCKQWVYWEFHFQERYGCIYDEAAISSIISENTAAFSYLPEAVGWYKYRDYPLNFIVRTEGRQYDYNGSQTAEYIIGISCQMAAVQAEQLRELFQTMLNCRLIYRLEAVEAG